ncbi:Gfo/Idh/MocA family protein [Granulosicoccus antarcticus]|uniref:Glucose--fructose oxidoreductase n=1 Tax=Granulosicoccus antarcticus IMCC3135 TaxID=1192854 RepID=A0A2Z2NN28_9GAMM|nr:Gfo/Idh/MocA family oxidoreductase [Granulosicoccus antarcticus]ASJ72633.1 Glucose--fructose oxidoreductase [Granulosicoccus antarcticus IMCC3135]
MLNFGIMSTAKIGRDHLVPAIQQADGARLEGVASRDGGRAAKMADHFNAPQSFDSYEAMLESKDIHAVYIPLPTSQHVEWAHKAILAGKHVLVEKPLALKASEINKLIKARDKAGVIVSEAYMVTYHPQWLKVRELLKKGTIGTLRHIDASFTYFNTDAGNMRNQVELGGGALPDIGVYPTVCARFATGLEPVSATASVEYDPTFKTDRYANIQLEFEKVNMSFYVSTQMANRQTMVFHGDKGFIELSAPFNSNLYEGDEVRVHNAKHSDTRIYRFTGVNQYRLEIEAFCRAVAGKKQTCFTLEESILNQKVIDAIYKSGKSGKRVKV